MVVFGLPVEKLAQATNVENEQSPGEDNNKRRFRRFAEIETQELGHPRFCFWIPIALAKICFSRIVKNRSNLPFY